MTLTADTDAPTTNGWAPAPAPLGETPRTPTEIDRLRKERDAAQAARNRIEADFESFKIRVATAGEAAARRHGWCSTYDAGRPYAAHFGDMFVGTSWVSPTPGPLPEGNTHR